MSDNERDERRPERVLMDWMDENNVTLIGSTPAMLVSVLRASGHMDVTDPDALLDDAKDTLIAAGYRKPRTITTVEELDALGRSAAILASNGAVWVNDGDSEEPWASLAEDFQGGPVWVNGDGIELPATVLHEASL